MKAILLLFLFTQVCFAQDLAEKLSGTWVIPSETKEDLLRTHEVNEFKKLDPEEDGCFYEIRISYTDGQAYLTPEIYCHSNGGGVWDALKWSGSFTTDGQNLILEIEEFNAETKEFLLLTLVFVFEVSDSHLKLTQM